MERRANRLIRIILFAALGVGVLPVIPVGEVLAPAPPDQMNWVPQDGSGAIDPMIPTHSHSKTGLLEDSPLDSPTANASTLDKLRLLFSR